MVRKLIVAAVLGACLSGSAISAWAGPTKTDQLKALARAYVEAQFSFDQVSLRRIVAPKFVEISPKGEVDEMDAVISFYASEKKTAAPPYSIENQIVRLTGTSAVVTQTVTLGTPPRSRSLSQAISASLIGSEWKLISSQSTPIPPPKP